MAMVCWVAIFGLEFWRTNRQCERTAARVSVCDEVVCGCVVKLKEMESFTPPDLGLEWVASSSILVQGRRFKISVQRANS